MNIRSNKPIVKKWLTEPMSSSVQTAIKRLARAPGVCYVAIMPDVHLCKDICVGTVTATDHHLYPQAVGGDIGCGMAAVRLLAKGTVLQTETRAAQLFKLLEHTVPIIKHPAANTPATLPDSLLHRPLSHGRLERHKSRLARTQFGTLGRGNHFLELQEAEDGWLWLLVHTGSRGMGQMITGHHLELASKTTSGLRYLLANSPQGEAYLNDAEWARAYASQSRQAIISRVTSGLKAIWDIEVDWESAFSCGHNHVRKESHFQTWLWVHRKGALSAQNMEPGIIPGSMGSASYHVTGRGHAAALCSSSHGAGRLKSRKEALFSISHERLSQEMGGTFYNPSRGRLREEAPSAYKNIAKVMRAQKELTRIVRRLKPLLNYKGS